MNNWLTYRNLLHGFTIITLMGAFALSGQLSALAESWTIYKSLGKEAEKVSTAASVLKEQELQLKKLKTRTDRLRSESVHIRNHQEMVAYLEDIARRLEIRMVSLAAEGRTNTDGYVLSEESFSIEGSLTQILTMLYTIEESDKVGAIIKADFSRRTERVENRPVSFLVADIHLLRLPEEP